MTASAVKINAKKLVDAIILLPADVGTVVGVDSSGAAVDGVDPPGAAVGWTGIVVVIVGVFVGWGK